MNVGVKQVIANTRKKGGSAGKTSYWIQRHDLTKLLRNYCLEPKDQDQDECEYEYEYGSVEIKSGSSCVNIIPTSKGENGGVEVLTEDSNTGELTNYQLSLQFGCWCRWI